jgi:hypothetical protein
MFSMGAPVLAGTPTVKDELEKVGAHVKDGKLYDNSGREIRFFTQHTGGYVGKSVLDKEREELSRLRDEYTVIVITFSMY